MPATASLISNRVGMTALLHILLCFEFVPPPNLLFFTFVFVLQRPPPFFCGIRVTELDICFWSEIFCRTFGPADWRLLSDIMKKCPIVRQVRRISTALALLQCNIWRATQASEKISCLSDWTICRFDSDRKPCLYPITWPCLYSITWSTELRSYNGTYIGVNPPAFCGLTPHFRQNFVKTPYFTIAPEG